MPSIPKRLTRTSFALLADEEAEAARIGLALGVKDARGPGFELAHTCTGRPKDRALAVLPKARGEVVVPAAVRAFELEPASLVGSSTDLAFEFVAVPGGGKGKNREETKSEGGNVVRPQIQPPARVNGGN